MADKGNGMVLLVLLLWWTAFVAELAYRNGRRNGRRGE